MRQPRPHKRVGTVLLALAAACLALFWRGPAWLEALRPTTYQQRHFLPDFFQDWASARNYYTGMPIYAPLEETLPLYLGEHRRAGDTVFTEVNAHPPASVLVMLPLGMLDYREAFLLWTELSLIFFAASLWLIFRRLDIRPGLDGGLALFALLLFCHPLLSHVQHGQWMTLLLLLITLTWLAERANHPLPGGATLGMAAALKFTPGFLFLPFLLRRRWLAILGGLASLMGLSMLAAVVLGPGASSVYFQDVLPHVVRYRGACHNLSLCGICYKLLAPLPHWMPVQFTSDLQAPVAAATVWVALTGLIVVLLVRAVCKHKDDTDLAISLAIVAMLLIAPITWDHYLLLLALPLAVLWQRLPRHGAAWPAFLISVGVVWLEPLAVMQHGLILLGTARSPQTGHWLAGPLEILTAISLPSYALLAIFLLLLRSPRWLSCHTHGRGEVSARDDRPLPLAQDTRTSKGHCATS